MADDKKKIGKPDRIRVSSTDPSEVRRLATKFELPASLVKNVVKQEGPMRGAVESYLRKMKQK